MTQNSGISQRLSELTAPTGEEPILDVSYPTPRLKIAPWQAVVAALAVIISALLWLALSSSSDTQQLPAIELSESAEPAVASAEAPPEEVVVSFVGAVEQPGIITLPHGSRIADALDIVGLSPQADIVSINHAQVLVDGEQIYVSTIGETPPAHSEAEGVASGGDSSKVNLNSATSTELMQLPGVGEVTAEAIISHRESVGSFSAVEELLDVSGIGPAKFEKLQDLVAV